jgi:uncharacterized membrane protein
MFTEKNKIILIILIIGLLYGIQPIIFSKIIDYNIPKKKIMVYIAIINMLLILAYIYYFDKELDNIILNDYNELNKNIMTISKEKSIEPWQVVSLLIKYKIINKRDEANGYDIYKKTDEYIEKLKK